MLIPHACRENSGGSAEHAERPADASVRGSKGRTHSLRVREIGLCALHRRAVDEQAVHAAHGEYDGCALLAVGLLHRQRRRVRHGQGVGLRRRGRDQGCVGVGVGVGVKGHQGEADGQRRRLPHHRGPHQRHRLGRRLAAHHRRGRRQGAIWPLHHRRQR